MVSLLKSKSANGSPRLACVSVGVLELEDDVVEAALEVSSMGTAVAWTTRARVGLNGGSACSAWHQGLSV